MQNAKRESRGTSGRANLPARQRSDPHGSGASRSQRPVPAKENPQAPARFPHSACHHRRGLRGTGILPRAEEGYEVDQIANDVGMSRQNVEHYMRFKDQMQVAAQGQKRLRLVSKED